MSKIKILNRVGLETFSKGALAVKVRLFSSFKRPQNSQILQLFPIKMNKAEELALFGFFFKPLI